MTAPAALLAYLRGSGFALTADGDRLTVAPRAKLTPAECERIREAKPGLLRLLADERYAAAWADLLPPNLAALGRLAECPACRALVDPTAGADVRTGCDRTDCPHGRPFSCRRK